MAIGDRIRIVTEEEYRIMSPPRHPKGEKPATTIRLQRRQMDHMERTIIALRQTIDDRDKVIAGYDVQLGETDDAKNRFRQRAEAAEHQVTSLREFIRDRSAELEFYRGYYVKSQETAAATRSVSVASPSFLSDQPETHAAERARDQENLSARRQRGQEAGIDQGAAGPGSRLGDPVWRQHPRYTPHPQGRPVEHIEVTEHGLPRERYVRENWGT